MNEYHIAIFNELGPTHVHPTFSIVAALIRRGYRVTYVTLDRYNSELSWLGAEVICCPPLDADSPRFQLNKRYAGDAIYLASRTLSQVTSFYANSPPRLILHDTLSFAGAILAETLHIPAVRTTPQLAYTEDTFGHPDKPHPADHHEQWMAKRARREEFFRASGVTRANAQFGKERPIIYFYPEELQLPRAEADVHSLYAARCAPERLARTKWRSARTEGRPSVLVTASTIYEQDPEYYKKCMQAALDLDWHVVLAIGENNSIESFQPLPPHCEIVQGVSQTVVMPSMDLIIGMAGTATTMEAMYHGLPLLVITPGYAEAEMYAENVQRHGLGLHIEGKQATVEVLKRSIAELTIDKAVRSNVSRMQSIVRRSPGGEEVVNWIEDYLQRAPEFGSAN